MSSRSFFTSLLFFFAASCLWGQENKNLMLVHQDQDSLKNILGQNFKWLSIYHKTAPKKTEIILFKDRPDLYKTVAKMMPGKKITGKIVLSTYGSKSGSHRLFKDCTVDVEISDGDSLVSIDDWYGISFLTFGQRMYTGVDSKDHLVLIAMCLSLSTFEINLPATNDVPEAERIYF